jgi:hypothetical protein
MGPTRMIAIVIKRSDDNYDHGEPSDEKVVESQ